MNTDTEPHLDLEELLAGVAGQPLREQARGHLTACPDCRAELAGWEKAAGGTQLLVAATDLPPWRFPAAGTAARPRRRALLMAAAAAAVLAAGGTTWGLAGSGSGTPATTAGLTAVTGCPGLAVTSGTLERIDGTKLVVRTRQGQDVTVTASAASAVHIEEPGSLSDITDGARVLVTSDPARTTPTTLAARNILVNLSPLLAQPVRPGGRATTSLKPGQLFVLGNGAVSDVHPGGFTVSLRFGPPIHVTTSPATVVDLMSAGHLSELRTGVHINIVGQSRSDGTLAAATVEQGADLPGIQVMPSRSATGSCDPSAVASSLTLGS